MAVFNAYFLAWMLIVVGVMIAPLVMDGIRYFKGGK